MGLRSDGLWHLRRWERSTLAAIATLLLGVGLGGLGFIRYLRQAASANNDLILEAAGRGADVSTTSSMGLTALAPVSFLIATPLGWLTGYLVVTGLVRSVANAVREPLGDPIVALIARTRMRVASRRSQARMAAGREALEGPAVADRLASATRFELHGADLVVVASRAKAEWTPGTVLDCGDRFYTVGEAVSRTLPVGLRTLYPLTETPHAGVFRRIVRYDLPAREPDRAKT
jgi:hypothetical protein